MTFGYYNNLNNNISCVPKNIGFRASNQPALSMPADLSIDNLVTKVEEEKKKKSTKKATTVGAVVLGVSAAVALLNPKFSPKFYKKLGEMQKKMEERIVRSKNNPVLNKVQRFGNGAIKIFRNSVDYISNVNPFKDIWFKRFCTKEGEFLGVKNLRTREKLKKLDKTRAKVTGGIHRSITNFFENISKNTVRRSYSKSAKKLDALERIMREQANKLSGAERAEIESKLAEVSKIREYFKIENLEGRFIDQEKSMANLERDFMSKFNSYIHGFRNQWVRSGEHFAKNMTYWSREIMQPVEDGFNQRGLEVVEKLVGNTEKNGLYKEIIETFSKHTSAEEQAGIKKLFKNADKQLRKANYNENTKFFDKKRDLILGSAPTDILSATLSLIISGIALASADNKEQRTSRLITGVIPVLAGVGVNIALASALVSGGMSTLAGVCSGFALSKIGSIIDHKVFGHNIDEEPDNKKAKKLKRNKMETTLNA